MKLDLDCVRDILLNIETLGFYETTNPDKLHQALPQYSTEDLTYTCLKLGEGGYITLVTFSILGSYQPGVKCVIGLTYQGHEFLEKIRPKTVWAKIQGALKNTGSFSFDVISKVAVGVLTEAVKTQVGIS